MSTKMIYVSALTLIFAGSCAASNGGGHVVGNSIIPAGAAKKMAENSCDCHAKKGDKSAKDCDCKKMGKDEKMACSDGDESCKK